MCAFRIDTQRIESIVLDTIHEYGQKIFDEAMSGLSDAPNIRSTFSIVKDKKGSYIYSDEVIAAYIEFGTGNYAREYLNGRPQEMVDEAIKFYVNGQGTMPAQPYIFPAYYKYKEGLTKEIDKRIQKYFDSL